MIDQSYLTLRALLSSWTLRDIKNIDGSTVGTARNMKFLSIEERTANEIHKQLLPLYREATDAPVTIYKCIRNFRTG
jgi:hypothetical protein